MDSIKRLSQRIRVRQVCFEGLQSAAGQVVDSLCFLAVVPTRTDGRPQFAASFKDLVGDRLSKHAGHASNQNRSAHSSLQSLKMSLWVCKRGKMVEARRDPARSVNAATVG